MNRLLVVLVLALFARLSQTCDFSCVDNHAGCLVPPVGDQCCLFSTQVYSYTSAAAKAAASAIAAAVATANAATSVGVLATAASTACAQASVIQSISMAIPTQGCCQINATATSNAQSAADAVARAACTATARAQAAAQAAAAASSAAQAATSAFTQAEALINATCCLVSAQLQTTLTIIGSYVVRAKSAVAVATAAAAQAQVTATATSNAAACADASAKSMVSVIINNCCTDTQRKKTASDSANAAVTVCNSTSDLQQATDSLITAIYAFANDSQGIANSARLADGICLPECANVLMTCCPGSLSCCSNNNATACLAARVASRVFMDAYAATTASANASASVEVAVGAFVAANTAAYAAAQAATSAVASVTVSVTQCNNVKVTVSTQAMASASSYSAAAAEVQASTIAYANAAAKADALATAVAVGISYARSQANTFTAGCCDAVCCNQLNYPAKIKSCCMITREVASSFSGAYENLVAPATASVSVSAQSVTDVCSYVTSSSTSSVYNLVKNQVIYLLQCYCPNCQSTVTTTPAQSSVFSSQGSSFSWGFTTKKNCLLGIKCP